VRWVATAHNCTTRIKAEESFRLYQKNGGITVKKGKIIFTGSFGEYFIMSLGLFVLSVVTFGILLPYAIWWQAKYFFTHLEIEMQDQI
jgi:uncharacterized membrane protein YjgN (DUF898 family)